MGLDISHDAFSGAYSAFNRLRQEIGRASGVNFPPHYHHGPDGEFLTDSEGRLMRNAELDNALIYHPDDFEETHPGLYEFLTHEDCEGEIAPEMCEKLADELESILPMISSLSGGGHIMRDGGYRAAVQRLIDGCRRASAANEPLEFG